MNWLERQPIDSRTVDLTEPVDWRVLRMSEDDVGVLEAELGITIPNFLRQWLIGNPFRDLPEQTRALICARDRLIHTNVELRREGYYGRKWPEHLLWIGDDWSGGAYFVDLTEKQPSVYWYDWEQGEGDTVLPGNSERHAADEFIEYVARLSE